MALKKETDVGDELKRMAGVIKSLISQVDNWEHLDRLERSNVVQDLQSESRDLERCSDALSAMWNV